MAQNDHAQEQEERSQQASGSVQLRGVREELDEGSERGRSRGCDGPGEGHRAGDVDQAPQAGCEAEDHAAAHGAPGGCDGAQPDHQGQPALGELENLDEVLTNGFAVHAYIVHCPYSADEEEHSVLVYASTPEMACEIGSSEWGEDASQCEARRAPEHDERARQYLVGRIENDPEYLRAAGWRLEGEWTCGCCGLAAFGMEKYAVCRMTSQCKECGCDDADSDEPPCTHEDGFDCG